MLDGVIGGCPLWEKVACVVQNSVQLEEFAGVQLKLLFNGQAHCDCDCGASS